MMFLFAVGPWFYMQITFVYMKEKWLLKEIKTRKKFSRFNIRGK